MIQKLRPPPYAVMFVISAQALQFAWLASHHHEVSGRENQYHDVKTLITDPRLNLDAMKDFTKHTGVPPQKSVNRFNSAVFLDLNYHSY